MRPRARLPLAALVAAGALAAGVAVAATGGPTPVAPTAGKVQARGVPFTFKVRAPAGADVFLRVGTSRALRADGTLRSEVYFRKMARRGGLFTKKTDVYSALPEYFLNRRGTYYWQAWRIECRSGSNDCNVEGPVRKFVIR